MIKDMEVSPITVGERVLNAIRTKEFYIFCDGVHTRQMLEARCESLLEAMDRQFPGETKDDK